MQNYFSMNTLKSVAEQAPAKLAATAGVTTLTNAMGVHIQICILFVTVLLLDLFTRYIAQAAKLWHDLYPQTPGTVYDYWKFRVQARKWRYFRSDEMRKKFISKCGTYAIILLVFSVCDVAMLIARSQAFLVSLGTIFLACTESISILENLQECGVKEAAALLTIINKRKDAIK